MRTIATASNVFVNPSFFTWKRRARPEYRCRRQRLAAEVYASNNTGAGANVNAGGGITVTGGYFDDNGGDGLTSRLRRRHHCQVHHSPGQWRAMALMPPCPVT